MSKVLTLDSTGTMGELPLFKSRGAHPIVMLAATDRWYPTVRLAMALKAAGCLVDAVCPSGHPFGMTGSRMVGTLANAMLSRGARYGVVTMCVGGGQGAAGLFEACN